MHPEHHEDLRLAHFPGFGVDDLQRVAGMVRMTDWEPGTELRIMGPDGQRRGVVQERFWA